jgi:hypothetical protein
MISPLKQRLALCSVTHLVRDSDSNACDPSHSDAKAVTLWVTISTPSSPSLNEPGMKALGDADAVIE